MPFDASWRIPWGTIICAILAIALFCCAIFGPPGKGKDDPPDDTPLDPPR